MGVLDTVKKGINKTLDVGGQIGDTIHNVEVGFAKGAGDTLMSVKRNVQKPFIEYTKLKVQQDLNKARESINAANEPLLKKLKELSKDDPKREVVKKMLQANQKQFADLQTTEESIMADIDNVQTGQQEVKKDDPILTKAAKLAQNLLNKADDSLKTTNKAQQVGFAGEKVAEFFVPGGAVTKADKAIKGAEVFGNASKLAKAGNAVVQVGGRAALQGGVAGLTSLGQSAYQGQLDTPEGRQFAADEAVKNAETAAVMTGAFDVLGRGVKALAKTGTESRLRDFKDSMTTTKSAYNKGVKYEIVNGKKVVKSDPIQTIMSTGIKPKVVDGKIVPDELLSHLDDQIQGLEDSRKAVLNPTVKVPADEFKKVIEYQIKNDPILQAQGKVNSTVQKLESVIDDWKSHQGDNLSLDFIDKVRANSNKTWDPETADIMKKLGDGARKVLYDSDEAVRPFLQQEGQYIAAKKFTEKLAGKAVKGGRLGKYFDQTAGAVIGSAGGPAGSIVGALAGNLVSKATQGQYFNSILGRVGTALEKAGVPAIAEKAIKAGVPRVLRPVSTNLGSVGDTEDLTDQGVDQSTAPAPGLTPEEASMGITPVEQPAQNTSTEGLTDEEKKLLGL